MISLGYRGIDPMCGFDFELYNDKDELVAKFMELDVEEDGLTCVFGKGLLGKQYIDLEEGRLRIQGELTLRAFEGYVNKEVYIHKGFTLGRAEFGIMPGRRVAVRTLKAKCKEPLLIDLLRTYHE